MGTGKDLCVFLGFLFCEWKLFEVSKFSVGQFVD